MGHGKARHSLHRRLLLLIFAIASSALLLFMLGLLALQYMNERRHVISSHEVLASVISNSSAAALTFDDRAVASVTLSRLKSVPSVDVAVVYREGGSQFVSYVREQDLAVRVPVTLARGPIRGPLFSDGRLFVTAPVVADGRTIGRLVLAINLAEPWDRAYRMIGLAVLLTLLLSLAAYLASRVAVRKVTRPVESLSDVVRLVSDSQDYSKRAEIFHEDEIGALARGFNAMLQKIEERDTELSEHRANLERIVEERTHQLNERNEKLELEIAHRTKVQADLVRAKELAEQASQAKSDFLANISHEIRTPLNAVIGLSDLLARTEMTARQARFVDSIRNAGRSLLALINDVLDFSRSEAGGVSLHEDDVDLRSLTSEAGSFLNGLAQQKGLELVLQIDDSVPGQVRGDAVRLRQILVNLVNNAIKFTERGSVTVNLSFDRASDRAGITRLVVSDTGIGIAASDLDRIFNAFEQVDSSATRSAGGSGLGLAITRKLVEAMEGSITVESSVGVGSKFSVAVPMAVSQSDTAPRQKPRDVFASVPVLIAGSDANENAVVEAFVSGWAMVPTVTPPANAVALLERAARDGTPFGLLICADQSCTGLLTRLRSEPAIATTPAIAIMPSSERRALPPDLRDHARVLARPLTQSGLQNTIRELLESREPPAVMLDDSLPQYALHILLTEDNATNRVVAIENLSSLGCTVDVAVDGVEAVEAFQRKTYDLIFMDCQMPRLDGFGATQKIRELEKDSGRRNRIVALTAHAMAGDREKCLAQGMDDYLIKPFSLEDMIRCLDRWCPGARIANVPAAAPDGSKAARSAPAEQEECFSSRVFDQAHIENLRRKKPGLWSALRAAFLGEAEAARNAVALAVESRDWATVRLVAHTMKSAAANVGAVRLSEVSKALEVAAKTGDLDACTAQAAEFDSLMRTVCAAMERDRGEPLAGAAR